MISKATIKLVKSLELKKFRDQEGLFIAEGPKVVGDLAKVLECKESFQDADDVRRLSLLKNPQGPVALFKIPRYTVSDISGKLILALDNVQDPGNLGTIIRVADWYGIDSIVCSENTVDVWNPKVVQATMGSLARVKVIYTNLIVFLSSYKGNIFGTFLNGENIYEHTLPTEGIIVMGNEGNGISQAIAERITHRLLIPHSPHTNNPSGTIPESLNVAIATAITLSEFIKFR